MDFRKQTKSIIIIMKEVMPLCIAYFIVKYYYKIFYVNR